MNMANETHQTSQKKVRYFRKHYALPTEHGAWIWLIGPFFVGLAAGGNLHSGVFPLAVAAMAVFLFRQPMTLIVKILSRRRGRHELLPAAVWAGLYGAVALVSILYLIRLGYGRVLWLAVPGILVFAWQIWLISQRAERGQLGIELVGAGVLSLSAPAAYWVAGGTDDIMPWLLWALTWLQASASIVNVYLRLAQRTLVKVPPALERWRMGARAFAYHLFNLILSIVLAIRGWIEWLIPLAFLQMFFDMLVGMVRPAVGFKPTRIGLRQLLASILFYILMIFAVRA
jgi:hypothetical protein